MNPPTESPIYMDNHATTRVDPRVVEAMLPYFDERFGNAGSITHRYGWEAREAVDRARESIAGAIGADAREIVFTSGATESNNLALRGVAERAMRRSKKVHIVSLATEHRAILDPLDFLNKRGCQVTLLPVEQAGSPRAGLISAGQVAQAIGDDTALVTVMLANNEIGALQPIAEIGAVCRERGVLLHCDATQAVGKLPVDVEELQIDLMSFSAHKMYGPKGIGALYVRRRAPAVRLEAQIYGGGQEAGLRSGTANVPGIVGFARALDLCIEEPGVARPESAKGVEMLGEQLRLAALRNRLYQGITGELSDIGLNGPALDRPELRLAGNLNVSFGYVEGQALLLDMQDRLAVSSGSACTSADPQPSHVLRALGLSEDLVRSSLRFGLGRFNTAQDVETAIEVVVEAASRLRKLSSMA